ncbi:hypothetical protein DY218_17545 [Streptomyces triticagri]|uniref:Uncharacterized protein n=1 Tax=Streptomyces triticagri TaxID=2293568 RepID=A0A372M394_9ACTN|nr:hypothetical protein [Streptomyces triticagri]RFU85398.1 hypothetical protein DY218_17545 [Streptomyces triticagri]
MTVIAFLAAVLVIGFEELVQWHYGPMGVVGLLLLSIGVKTRSATCSSMGAIVLTLLVARPTL